MTSWLIVLAGVGRAQEWEDPPGTPHFATDLQWSADPAPDAGPGISVSHNGIATNPSSACGDVHVLALDVNKTSWSAYGFSNVRNPGNADKDTFTCLCALHPNESRSTHICGGAGWGGSYTPSVPPTSPGPLDLFSLWHDNMDPNPTTRDTGVTIAMKEKVLLVGVGKMQVFYPNASGTWVWQDVGMKPIDVVTGAKYQFRALPDPEKVGSDNVSFPAGWPIWSLSSTENQQYGSTTGQSSVTTSFASQGIYTYSVACGSTHVDVTVRSAALWDVWYKRTVTNLAEASDDYLVTDGGGVEGEVLYQAAFTYQGKLTSATLARSDFQGYTPQANFRFDAYNLDIGPIPSQLIESHSGIRTDFTLGDEALTFAAVRCYVDNNGDGHWNSGEPYVDKYFRVDDKTVHHLRVRYGFDPDHPTDSPSGTVGPTLHNAANLCFERDNPLDYRALVDFSMSECTQYLKSDSTPIDIRTEADSDLLFGAQNFGDVIIPRSAVVGWNGYTEHVVPRILIDPPSFGTAQVYAHEMGHYIGDVHDCGAPDCPCGEGAYCEHLQPTAFNRKLIMYHTGGGSWPKDPDRRYLYTYQAAGYEMSTH